MKENSLGSAGLASIFLLRGHSAASARLEALLRRHAPDVEVCVNAMQAIERCLQDPPPIVALDWSDGTTAAAWCAEVRALPNAETMVVIALAERAADFAHILAAGADDFLIVDDVSATARLAVVRERAAQGAAAREALAQTQSRLVLAGQLASVGKLAGGIAHEINNPLAFVITNIDAAIRRVGHLEQRSGMSRGTSWGRTYAGDRSGSTELLEVLQLLEDAREGAERIRLIGRDLHAFSRPEDARSGPVNVARVLESCVHLAMHELRNRAKIVRDFQESSPVAANEPRLALVFLNLLVNAAQAIPEGSADDNEIRLATRPGPAGWVVIEVCDSGKGIEPETLEHLFDPIATSGSSRKSGDGLGLGLATCRSIVTGLGGTLDVQSRAGEGSTFRVTLPAAPSEPDNVSEEEGGKLRSSRRPRLSSRPPSADASAAPRRRILVVDDEPLLARAIAGTLDAQHDTRMTASARDALDQIRAGERYDVILCDLMMPEMTGMDLYESLGEIAPEQQQRMVFLTGGAFTERGRAFLEHINARLLVKPFDADTLLSLVAEVIASS